MDPFMADHLELMAAAAHTDTQRHDKYAAAEHGKDRSTVNRWRNLGKGSPVHACIQYLMRCADPMRVAATILAAARMRALGDKSTDELILLYWQCREAEALREHEDRMLDSGPPHAWDWRAKADASARDAAVDTTKEAIERIFAVRRVDVERVWRAGR